MSEPYVYEYEAIVRSGMVSLKNFKNSPASITPSKGDQGDILSHRPTRSLSASKEKGERIVGASSVRDDNKVLAWVAAVRSASNRSSSKTRGESRASAEADTVGGAERPLSSRPSSKQEDRVADMEMSTDSSPAAPVSQRIASPPATAEEIEAMRDLGRDEMIAFALTKVRIAIARELLEPMIESKIHFGGKDHESWLDDEISIQVLKAQCSGMNDLTTQLDEGREAMVLDYLTGAYLRSWAQPTDGIGERLTGKLVEYWRADEGRWPKSPGTKQRLPSNNEATSSAPNTAQPDS